MIPFVITGDTHGEYQRMWEICRHMKKYGAKEKYLCVAGDFGYLFLNSYEDHAILNELEKQDFTVIAVLGNHENYTEIKKHDIVDFHGAKAYKLRNNIFCIGRGEIFKIGKKSFFTMSGGYSVDKYMRRENVTWWKDEMPTDDEYKYALENIERYRSEGNKIDYIISHTASLSSLAYLGKTHGEKERPLNNFLEYVTEILADEYKMHFFGHLHVDKEIGMLKARALWFDYVELDLDEE